MVEGRLGILAPPSSWRGSGSRVSRWRRPRRWESGVSVRLKLSDSDKSGSRAARGRESAATPPALPHAGDSAGDTADCGADGRLQSLPYLYKGRRYLESYLSTPWNAHCLVCSTTYDFHHVELKFVRQHVQGVHQAAAYQLQVLLCVMGEVQPHFPVLLSGHGQRPEENRRRSEKLTPLQP